ncbi:hypothetical protein ACSFE6_16005 [Pseudomonas baetica]
MPSFKDPIFDPDPDPAPSERKAIRTSNTLRQLHGRGRVSRVVI